MVTRGERREAKNRKGKMKVSGRSVLLLAKIDPRSKKSRRSH